MDPHYLRPLRKDDYFVASFGATAGSVPYRVRRATVFDLFYDPVKQGVLASGGMVQAGGTASGTQSAAFVDNQLFGLSSTVTNIAGVQDVLQVQTSYEVLQIWYGIAPRQVRVWAKQPYGVFRGVLDQNINPASTYPDVGFIDGFDSPYNRPSKETELMVFRNIFVNWALYNAGPWPVNPRIFFVINRMFVQPVKDAKTAVALLDHRLPAHHVSIGNPQGDVTYDADSYGKVKPITQEQVSEGGATLSTALAKGGYC